MNLPTTKLVNLVETRSGMRMFVRAVREGWPMDAGERDGAMLRLREIGREDRGRVSWRARQAVADVEAATAHFEVGGRRGTLPAMTVTSPIRRRR